MSETPIEWTHEPGFVGETWNPTLGCSKQSPGCKYCYAIRTVHRLAHNPNAKIAAANAGLVVLTGAGLNWTGRVNAIESRLEIPLRRRRPTCWFVNSLSDLFHPEVPAEFVYRVFGVMEKCRQHRFIVLTKQAARMWGLLRDRAPLRNVRLGISAENQHYYDLRIDFLMKTPAWQRIVSYEPALDRINFRLLDLPRPGLDQIIFGGESGPAARPLNLRWIRAGIGQCREANVKAFIKQLGSRPGISSCADIDCTHPDCSPGWLTLEDRKGGDMSEWPEDLRGVREYPA